MTSASNLNVEIEYLRGFLADEFMAFNGVRVQMLLPTTTQRSLDLVQDYDPESSDVHLKYGVRVRAGSREFFFPVSWVKERRMELVHSQAREVREYLEWKSGKID